MQSRREEEMVPDPRGRHLIFRVHLSTFLYDPNPEVELGRWGGGGDGGSDISSSPVLKQLAGAKTDNKAKIGFFS
jgi:hypothetical protein